MDRESGSRRPPTWIRMDALRTSATRAPREEKSVPFVSEHLAATRLPGPLRRVCVLEDSYSNLRLMLRWFHERGHHVDHFANLDAALDALAQGDFDALIVSDSMAGGGRACQAAIARVRGTSGSDAANLPILAIARTGDAARARVLETTGASRAVATLTEDTLDMALTEMFSGNSVSTRAARSREPRVLLFEDSYSVSLVLSNALIQAQRSMVHVTTLDQARAALSQDSFETVIVSQPADEVAAALTEIVATVKSKESSPELWVLTEDLDPRNVDALRAAGVAQVLSKADPVLLGDALVRLFERIDAAAQSPTPPSENPPSKTATNTPVISLAVPAHAAAPGSVADIGAQSPRRLFAIRRRWWTVAAAVSATLLAWPLVQATMFAATVQVAAVQRGTMEITVPGSGVIVSRRQVELSSAQNGQLYRVHVNEGDLLRKGEVLASLDPREATIDVRRAEALLFRYRNELAHANRLLQTLRAGTEEKAAPSVLSDAETARTAARAKLRVAEQDLQSAQLALERLAIIAPFAGVVTRATAVEGMWVRPGDALFTLADFDAREIAVRMPADAATAMVTGEPARVSSVDGDTERWQEHITRVGMTLPESGAAPHGGQTWVYVSLGNEAPAMSMGQRVHVELITDIIDNALMIPTEAVVVRDGENVVAAFDEGRVALRNIRIGLSNDQYTSVRGGLSENDKIILHPGMLKDGARVAVRADSVDTQAR